MRLVEVATQACSTKFSKPLSWYFVWEERLCVVVWYMYTCKGQAQWLALHLKLQKLQMFPSVSVGSAVRYKVLKPCFGSVWDLLKLFWSQYETFWNFKWSALCTFMSKYAKSVIGDVPNNFQLKEKDISSCLLKAVFFPIRIVVSNWVKPTRPNVNYAKDWLDWS